MNQIVYIGAGCFWGVETYYKQIKGVVATEVGYANGNSETTSYEKVCDGSGHVEVVKVTFNPQKLSYDELFTSYIRIIDPQSKNKQGNDVGIQYRTGLYATNKNFLAFLKQILVQWETKNFQSVIEIEPLFNYTKAEAYHQNYLTINPNGYCHINLTTIPKALRK